MNIAIVGSEEKHWEPYQRDFVVREIVDLFKYYSVDEPPRLISGGCPKGGVDIWAEIIAVTLDYPRTIFYPEVNQWNNVGSFDKMKKGYKSRNIEIVENCDVLYCFDPKDRDWSGGMWTLNKALELGKEAHHIRV